MPVFWSKVSGPFAPLFWAMVVCNFVIPFPILAIKRLRTIAGVTVASLLILVGMWLERFLIIVPTLTHPYLPFNYGSYRPSWVEVSIAAGTFGIFTLLYFLFVKISPIVSVWEIEEGRHLAEESVSHQPAVGGSLVDHVAAHLPGSV